MGRRKTIHLPPTTMKGEQAMFLNHILQLTSIPRKLESWNIGMRRVNKIVAQETRAGFQTTTTGMYSDGADILVFEGNMLVRVYEVTNYAKPEYYISQDKADRYRDNLLQYPVQRVFVCSYEENLNSIGGREFFEQHDIEVRVMGYQD